MSINTNDLRIFADKLAVEADQQYLHAVASELDATRTERNLLRQALTASEARAEAAEAKLAEALLNPDPWRPIEEADKGDGKWFGPAYATWHPKRKRWLRSAWNPRFHAAKAEGYWQTDGGSVTQDRDDPPTHFRELKGPGQ